MRVLLVEDDPGHRALVRRSFSAADGSLTLVEARTLAEARPLIGGCALVLVDLRLPDGSGLELLEGHEVPTVILTSFGDERRAVQAIKAGALDYVVKSDRVLLGMEAFARRALREAELVAGRRAAELALQESREQLARVQSFEALGLMAGGLAHDLNNILTVIKGNLCAARFTLEDIDEPHDMPLLIQEMEEVTERATALTRQLLVLGRGEVGSPQVVSLPAVVRGLERMLRRLIREDISLTVTVDERTPPVFANITSLEQLVLNLAINARDAMPTGGALAFEIAPTEDLRAAVLKVRDTGTGIDEETRGRIFEPFFTTKKGSGTGLGLSVVHRIVEEAGGEVRVDSAPGEGACFVVTLPANDEPAVPALDPQDTAPEAAPEGRGVVLVCDDDELIRKLLIRTLKRAGFSPCAFGRPSRALEAAERIPELAAVLSDVVMPEMRGYELVDRIRAHHPSVPCLFITGYVPGELYQRLEGAGDVRLLSKPFSGEALLTELYALLQEAGRGIAG